MTVPPSQTARRAPLALALLCGGLVAACAGRQPVEEARPGGAGSKDRSAAAKAGKRAPTPDDQREARDLFERAVGASAGDPAGAAETFERAFELDPGLALAAYDAGVLHERLGKLDRAEKAYRRALGSSPDLEPASLNLTRLRLRRGRAGEAERDLRARIAARPASLALRNQLIEVLLATHRADAAEQEARKILKADERNVPAMVNLAQSYQARKRNELAKMVLENARQLDAQDAVVWNRLAAVELALGNRDQALEDLKQATTLREDYAEAAINYGALLVEIEDYPGAARVLERAVPWAPASPQLHLDLGNAYRGLSRFDDAQREYQKAAALDGKMADAHFNLGVLYLDGEKAGLPTQTRLEQAVAHLDAYAAAGGKDPKLPQIRKEAASSLEKEKKRIAREEKDRLRKEAEARKRQATPAPARPPGDPAPAEDGGKK